jgi:glycerophosphoryl diester phosphodiesterase
MTSPTWGDPLVSAALRDVVDDLGRRTAFAPPRLRAALNDDLGSRAHEFRAAIDALVLAAEASVPQSLLDGVPSADLPEQLASVGLLPEAAQWAVENWATALRIPQVTEAPPAAPPPTALPPTALPPTAAPPVARPPAKEPPVSLPATALPVAAAATALPDVVGTPAKAGPAGPAARVPVPVQKAASGPASGTSSPLATRAQSEDGPRRGRVWLIAGSAAAVVGLVAAVGVAGALGRDGDDGTAASRTPIVTTESGAGRVTPTPSSTARATPPATAQESPKAAELAPLVVLAHEGGWERAAPETTASLVDAARRGAAAETDVRWTSDGVAILIHDERVIPPMRCAKGRQYVVAQTTWAVLKSKCWTSASAYKDKKAHRIPTFAEGAAAVAAVPGARLFAEVKVEQSPKQIGTFLRILRDNGLIDRTVVTSFLPGELAKLRTAARRAGTDVRLMQFVRDDSDLTPSAARKAGLWAVAVRQDAVTKKYVKSLHAASLKVIAWTINETSGWSKARAAGVDYVLTDRPIAYRAWLKGN